MTTSLGSGVFITVYLSASAVMDRLFLVNYMVVMISMGRGAMHERDTASLITFLNVFSDSHPFSCPDCPFRDQGVLEV